VPVAATLDARGKAAADWKVGSEACAACVTGALPPPEKLRPYDSWLYGGLAQLKPTCARATSTSPVVTEPFGGPAPQGGLGAVLGERS
jgi:hypothetical protein